MIIFIIFIIAIFALLSYLSSRYSSPYTLTFIFGKKGAGKSTLLCSELLKHKKRGWVCYTDMPDCNIPGVRIIDSKSLDKFVPVPHSFLALDEVGLTYNNRNFKSFSDGLTEFYKFQRKYKCKILMNSQCFDVDKKIRDLTDKMILQVSLLGCISISRPIKRTVTLTEPTGESESRIADRLKFESFFNWRIYWIPKYWKYFDSFSAPERPQIAFREVGALLSDDVSQAVQFTLGGSDEDIS